MLSAESAPGQYPQEAVTLIDRIIAAAENDRAHYRPTTDAARPEPTATIPDAICASMRQVTGLLPVAAVVTYTTSGSSSLRAARERPATSILSMATSHGNSPTADTGPDKPDHDEVETTTLLCPPCWRPWGPARP